VTNPKIIKLLESLKDATARGEVQWSDAGEGNAFRISTKDANLFLNKVSDDDQTESKFIVNIFSKSGSFSTSGPLIETVSFEAPQEVRLCAEIFELARRSVYKVDELIDRMISEISSRKR
jgi:hypothetical protein